MNMEFKRKLPIPMDIKGQYPVTAEIEKIRENRDKEIKAVFEGKDKRLILIIGPCSADKDDSVIDYISRLRNVQEKVSDKLLIIPRIYTNKPRTTGDGYKGMLHQPDPNKESDMLKGLVAIRHLHLRAIRETGFTCTLCRKSKASPYSQRSGYPCRNEKSHRRRYLCYDEFDYCRSAFPYLHLQGMGGRKPRESSYTCNFERICEQIRTVNAQLSLRGSYTSF